LEVRSCVFSELLKLEDRGAIPLDGLLLDRFVRGAGDTFNPWLGKDFKDDETAGSLISLLELLRSEPTLAIGGDGRFCTSASEFMD
jgi:hypothetical protein